jgi:hypothetical protein
MKIWKIAGVMVVVVLALGMLGVGMVFAQTVVPKLGTNNWGNMMGGMMGRGSLQGTPSAGYGMMGSGGMMGQGGMTPALAPGASVDFDDMGAMHTWMMGPNGMHTQMLTDLAKTLNLKLEDLQSQLQSGRTLTQIAQAQGISQAQLETALETSVKDNLAKAVTAGTITQKQADQMLSYMNGNYAQMLTLMGSRMMSGGAGGCHGNGTPTGTGA